MGVKATQNPLECTPAVLSRFLGEFASLVALQTAHPLPTSGSYAVVNETGSDLIYYWSDADQDYFTPQSAGGGSQNLQQVLENGQTYEVTPPPSGFDYIRTRIQAGLYCVEYRVTSEGIDKYTLLSGGGLAMSDGGNFVVLEPQINPDGTFVPSSVYMPETTGYEVIATREWTNSQNFEKQSNKGVANGYTPLNASSKIDATYLPDSILGQVNYQGTWNASTNSPSIPSASSSNKGYYYIVNVAGTTTINGINDWQIGDWIISNGTTWSKVDNTDAISSFNGRTGAITLVSTDVTSALGFTPENSTNKATTMTGNTASNTVFLSAKAVYDWVTGLLANASTAGIMKLFTSTGTATDGTMTQKAITDALDLKSNKANWVDISNTSTIVGWASFTQKSIAYKVIDNNLVYFKGILVGVSNSGLANFDIPFTSANTSKNVGVSTIVNNSIIQNELGVVGNQPNTNIVNIYRNTTGSAFATSGTKTVEFSILIQL